MILAENSSGLDTVPEKLDAMAEKVSAVEDSCVKTDAFVLTLSERSQATEDAIVSLQPLASKIDQLEERSLAQAQDAKAEVDKILAEKLVEV